MTFKRLVFLPDTQIPLHDRKTVDAITTFVGDYQPDHLYHVGDFVDFPQVSRWSKGTAEEYSGTIASHCDEGKAVLEKIRRRYDGPFTIKRGNHDMRVEYYVRKYAPGLVSLPGLCVEDLLDLGKFDVAYERPIVDVAPGWVMAHGDEGSLARVAGSTALNLGISLGKSVVCGHTHKAALKHGGPGGYNGRQAPPIWGMEVGHAMDIRKASYLKTGAAPWQQALGILYVSGTTVIPSLIPITRGSFVVEGRHYGP